MKNKKIRVDNKSGITGVSWAKKRKLWNVSICESGKSIFLGYFKTKLDAVKARWNAEKKHNFPNCNTTSTAYLYLKNKGGIRYGSI